MRLAWLGVFLFASCTGGGGGGSDSDSSFGIRSPLVSVLGVLTSHYNQAEKRDFVLKGTSCALSYTCTPSDPRAQVLMNSCSIGSDYTQSGRLKLGFSSSAACTRHRDSGSLSDGESFTRTFLNAATNGIDESVSVLNPSGRLAAKIRPLGTSQMIFLNDQWRLEFAAGLERSFFGTSLSVPEETHTLSTLTEILSQNEANSREILSGELELVSSKNSNRTLRFDLSGLKWNLERCCLPVSGNIQVTITSTLGNADPDGVGTETYAFLGCQKVNYTDLSGQGQEYSLPLGCE